MTSSNSWIGRFIGWLDDWMISVHISPSNFPFLAWKSLGLFNLFLYGRWFFSFDSPFCPSLYIFLSTMVFFFFCDGGGFRHCQHYVSLLCSLFLCWHSACSLSTCISEHWDGVIAHSILTLGPSFQGARLSLGAITVDRVRTVSYVLNFIFVYIELHLLFYHLDAGNLPCLWVFTHNLLLPFSSAF